MAAMGKLQLMVRRATAADDLCNGEGHPDQVHLAGQAQQVGGGQQHQHLAAQGDDGGIDAVAQGLEAGTQGNTDGGNGEAPADGPQSHLADLQEGRGGVEHIQHDSREELEHGQAQKHNAHGGGAGVFQALQQAVGLPRTIVVGHDGDGGVVDAEQGHEEEALQLKVHAEDAGGGFGEALQNLVHAEAMMEMVALLMPNRGMKKKLCSLKYTPKTLVAVSVKPCKIWFMPKDGDGGVVDAEQGHEEEALQLKVHAEDAGGGFGEALQNLVHAEVHHGTDAVHHNGGHADGQDAAHGFLLQLQILLAELNLRVVPPVEEQCCPRFSSPASDTACRTEPPGCAAS